MFDGEALEVGAAVWVMGEGEDRIALEAGELPLEDGRVLVIGDDSIVAEIKDASAEAPAEEELNAETTTPSIPNSEAVGAIKQLIVKYSEQWDEKFKSLEDSLMEFKKENKELKAEVVELSNQPASAPIKTVVKQVELTAKGRMLEAMRNNKQ